MGTICKVGETKNIRGQLYMKQLAPGGDCGACTRCSFNARGCPLPSRGVEPKKTIEAGGSECDGTIWKRIRVTDPIDRSRASLKKKGTK